MAVMCKVTPTATVGAWRHENGVAMGIVGKENCVSLEYNPDAQQIELLIMDERIAENSIVVRHVDKNWKEVSHPEDEEVGE